MAPGIISLSIVISFFFQIPGVPLVRQKVNFCGPAALTSVFRFYGRQTTQEEIAERVYLPALRGSLITDLENHARRSGFHTQLRIGKVRDLRRLLLRGIPVIILIDEGFWILKRRHYLLLYGFDDEAFLAYDGQKAVRRDNIDLLRRWHKMGGVYLAVYDRPF